MTPAANVAVPVSAEELERLLDLLEVAMCPHCDGSGSIAVLTGVRQLVTREMAIDAGDASMEGSLYSDDEWEQQQCQWCDERNTVIAARKVTPQKNTVICSNCDSAMPEGCGGVFEGDGDVCLRTRNGLVTP